jgi:hypothetical protein
MVMEYSGIIPNLIIPPTMGVVFDLFSTRAEAYKCFFLIAAFIHIFSSFLYLQVYQAQKDDAARVHGTPPDSSAGRLGSRRAPVGARLCDRVLFGELIGTIPGT